MAKNTAAGGFPVRVKFIDDGTTRVIRNANELMKLSGREFNIVEKNVGKGKKNKRKLGNSHQVSMPSGMELGEKRWIKVVDAHKVVDAQVSKANPSTHMALFLEGQEDTPVIVTKDWFERYKPKRNDVNYYFIDHRNGYYTLSTSFIHEVNFERLAEVNVPADAEETRKALGDGKGGHKGPRPDSKLADREVKELQAKSVQEPSGSVEKDLVAAFAEPSAEKKNTAEDAAGVQKKGEVLDERQAQESGEELPMTVASSERGHDAPDSGMEKDPRGADLIAPLQSLGKGREEVVKAADVVKGAYLRSNMPLKTWDAQDDSVIRTRLNEEIAIMREARNEQDRAAAEALETKGDAGEAQAEGEQAAEELAETDDPEGKAAE